ncbi:MAG: c-type cytochrome [Saprospiraceae bacterium]|nr:c-type cytochrome [Saprospiraceae bacterium]
MKTKTIPFLLFVFVLSLSSCLKDDVTVTTHHYSDAEYAVISQHLNLPKDVVSYQVELPQHMKNLGMVAPNIQNAKATLGRVLFFDKKLSKNNTVSCESCHKQNIAFSDDRALSEGFAGEETKRNSLALGSVANFESSYGSNNSFGNQALFFWDERAHTISQQSAMTIEDEIEMGMPMSELVQKLSNEEYYQILFRKAYGDEIITSPRITEALQEFLNSLLSVNSRFDEGMDRKQNAFSDFPNFNSMENMGKQLFQANCSSCHGSNMSQNNETVAHNGLDAVTTDPGVGAITNREFDEGKFKIPFLRNIALTGPYMHDGRFETLYDVVEHYSSGIQMHPNLDFRLRNPSNGGQPLRMNFTDQEKEALVAFLETLTDPEFVSAEKFGNPFN